jgi:hypothetical protein
VLADPAGVECAYAAVKASFDLSSGVPRLAVRQAGFLAGDVHWGDPAATSLHAAADLTHLKPATDVLLLGRAVAAGGPVEAMDVSLRVGPVSRRLRVFGNRRWMREGDEWVISRPEPFARMPLCGSWPLAGMPAGAGGVPEVEARNPVGRGLVGADEGDIAGRPLPNIEDPEQLIARPADRPAPAGLAPIPPAWQPRRGWAGTYDAAWQARRAPYLPLDFDPRFFNVAPPGWSRRATLPAAKRWKSPVARPARPCASACRARPSASSGISTAARSPRPPARHGADRARPGAPADGVAGRAGGGQAAHPPAPGGRALGARGRASMTQVGEAVLVAMLAADEKRPSATSSRPRPTGRPTSRATPTAWGPPRQAA